MKVERVYLDDLTVDSASYKVKVKVIDKGRASPGGKKGIPYQALILQDDKGNKMRAALFGDQIAGFEDVLQYNGVYEIANAQIKATDDRWRQSESELRYQMSFGRKTIVQPIDGQASTLKPNYQTIASIPRAADSETRFDVLGIVLYAEKGSRAVPTSQTRTNLVREVVVMDHSVHHSLVISLWNDLAGGPCDKLVTEPSKFLIAGFTALRASLHKGFSLTTSMSSTIIHTPAGVHLTELENWISAHQADLVSYQSRVFEARNLNTGTGVVTLQHLCQKKAKNTLQEERHWIRATLYNLELDQVNAYTGCSKCGKRTDMPLGTTYSCTNCLSKNTTAVPRITFNCSLDDGTATLVVTTFTEDAAKLLRMSVDDIFSLKQSADETSFKAKTSYLQTTPTLIQLSPKMTLSRTNVLQWAIKSIDNGKAGEDQTEDETLPPIKRKLNMDDTVNEKTPAKKSMKSIAQKKQIKKLPIITKNNNGEETVASPNAQENIESPKACTAASPQNSGVDGATGQASNAGSTKV